MPIYQWLWSKWCKALGIIKQVWSLVRTLNLVILNSDLLLDRWFVLGLLRSELISFLLEKLVSVNDEGLHSLYFRFVILVFLWELICLSIELGQFLIDLVELVVDVIKRRFRWHVEYISVIKCLQLVNWNCFGLSLFINCWRLFVSVFFTLKWFNLSLWFFLSFDIENHVVLAGFIVDHLVDNKVVVIFVFVNFELFIFCFYMFSVKLICRVLRKAIWTVCHKFVFALVVNHEWDLLSTKYGEFDSLFDKSSFSFAISDISDVDSLYVLQTASILLLSSFLHLYV